jgi:hypothetical protein
MNRGCNEGDWCNEEGSDRVDGAKEVNKTVGM